MFRFVKRLKKWSTFILHPTATYNETRFRFNKRIPYAWSNDEYTLGFCVFPEFEQKLLDRIKDNKPFSLEILPGQYQVRLSLSRFKQKIIQRIKNKFNQDYFESCLDSAREKYKKERLLLVDQEVVVLTGNTKRL